MREGLLALVGFSFGALSAAGVFTVLAAVSLVPRFVGKTHTGKDVKTYENMIILGTIVGGMYSLYEYRFLAWKSSYLPWAEFGVLAVGGIFCGMFVGCLALAIAEMLDSIPIFARRARLSKGAGVVVLSIAIGKLVGSLLYFFMERRGW
ncbi:MAG: stage V sporulation protein AB [Lachnospiraceae bacterium]|nr:stage V sporulation protein AB [Lachnospiraceae bacterium]